MLTGIFVTLFNYVTFRRIAETTNLGPEAAQDLRRHLVNTRPARYAWPLWSVTAASHRGHARHGQRRLSTVVSGTT